MREHLSRRDLIKGVAGAGSALVLRKIILDSKAYTEQEDQQIRDLLAKKGMNGNLPLHSLYHGPEPQDFMQFLDNDPIITGSGIAPGYELTWQPAVKGAPLVKTVLAEDKVIIDTIDHHQQPTITFAFNIEEIKLIKDGEGHYYPNGFDSPDPNDYLKLGRLDTATITLTAQEKRAFGI